MRAETFAADAHLFQPQPAWRFRWNKNTDTPLPPDEPAGDNPPDGAIVNYWLKQDARSPVTLEILDAGGAVVRRYSSADAPEPPIEGRNTPDYWLRPPQTLSAKAGFHRFVWDVRHERPAVAGFSYPIAAIHAQHAAGAVWIVGAAWHLHGAADGRWQGAHRTAGREDWTRA